MNNRIVEIENYKTNSNAIEFVGTLRNEKKFEMLQKVFILCDETMYQCRIIGIELTLSSNPEYIYKIELPQELIEKREGESYIQYGEKDRVSKTCEDIFNTIKEAKESALKKLDLNYKLNKENITRFFENNNK
ncbi:hypothetical protein UFOVP523_42 [uncultured Caudovirales phage]|uniref:Uncharacterized protein n=1 Tax=uncultured Caudovirales phage TaxID=2100421 RepID=A0A6J5MVG7_9CAUD|nr:hypothetical protein UFOVP523_42 [uncultured Caudovirales phage]